MPTLRESVAKRKLTRKVFKKNTTKTKKKKKKRRSIGALIAESCVYRRMYGSMSLDIVIGGWIFLANLTRIVECWAGVGSSIKCSPH